MIRVSIFSSILLCISLLSAHPAKKVLVAYEGSDLPANFGRGDGRQMATLLGHFDVEVTLRAVNDYKGGEINSYDAVFYVGFTKKNDPPDRFERDVLAAAKTVVWMNTGMEAFASRHDVKRRFGFTYIRFDSTSNFDLVRSKGTTFTKTEPNANIIAVVNPSICLVLATTSSTSRRTEVPYLVRSGNFYYVVDSPFASATETDRYLLFADMLHDILQEDHPESHSALIRIEDITPLDDPSRLREIADILSSRDIPFLISLVPIYVSPEEGLRIPMSEKPDFVDALHYMMEHGGTVVMHGVTHQYKGISASDFEFWDESLNRPIRGDSKDYVEKKLRAGIEECLKNNVFPLLWETPHYGASMLDYSVFAKFFSTAIEQRLAIDDLDYSQFFPYIIYKDLFGQKIYPENLGYIPLDDDMRKEEAYVRALIRNAKANLAVRDGFASCFFHTFLDLSLLEQLVEGIEELGYTYIDVKQETNIVQLKDRVVATGQQTVAMVLDGQYLREEYFNEKGELEKKEISHDRLKGIWKKSISLSPGWVYVAEPSEYKEREITFWTNLGYTARTLYEKAFPEEKRHEEARPAILWSRRARGGERRDQQSFAAVFQSLNVPVDTLFSRENLSLGRYNLLTVPYGSVDALLDTDFDKITAFVSSGGCVITDSKNELAATLGIRFADSFLKLDHLRDHYFPEDLLRWSKSEIIHKFDVEESDEVLCIDDKTDAPVVVGRKYGNGKFIFIGSRFDPESDGGFSRYPYLFEYIKRYFGLFPLFRRDFLEVYFDPGFRHTISVESLVKNWAADGVRIVHVAGWHTYPKYTYDYARLLRLAHANGILVYAWLEPPQVSQKFWNEHPEWREKNHKGNDVRPAWRYPMAMTDTGCIRAMAAEYSQFLQQYDWDGVNLSELYFESGRGPIDPDQLTPMHPSARRDFRRRFGFDPALLIDPSSLYFWRNNEEAWKNFENYRVEWVTRLHEYFLETIQMAVGKKAGFQTIVTAMDDIHSPELRRYVGIDIRELMELRRKFDFVLQVEDPQSMWSTDPRRYEEIGKRFQLLTGKRSAVMLDLNILSFRKENTRFPTLQQTGIESYQLVRSAASGADRFTIYSESSVNPQDLKMFPYAMAARASWERTPQGWDILSPYPLTLQLSREYQEILLDGERQLSARPGEFLIPAGEHSVALFEGSLNPFDTNLLGARIVSITGALLFERSTQRSVEFRYTSVPRCIVTFNREPYAVFLDDNEYAFQALQGYECYGVIFPSGTHHVRVVAESGVSYGVDVTSLWSSSLIVIFGFVSGGLLIVFYVVVRVRRGNLG